MSKKEENQTTKTSLELLYSISRELAAALDLNAVLRRVLFLSMQNVNAISGSIIVLDKEGQPIDSAIITGEVFHDHTTQQLRITYEQGLAGWVARQRDAVLVPDTSVDPRWLLRPDDSIERTGAKSAVSAPILARDQLIGVITLVHPQPGFFQIGHLNLIKAIADQAGIAVLNARLYAESQRQAQVMTALANSATVITGSLNQEEVLQRILEQTSRALQVDIVSLALIETATNELVFVASTGRGSQNVIGIHIKLGTGIAGWVAVHGEGTVVTNVRNDDRFYPEVDRATGFKTRAIACAPIRWRGEIIGVLEALNPVNDIFNPDALGVLTGIGSLAGTAIRHAQLFESLQAAHKRYRELFEDSIDAILITDWDGRILVANRQAEGITRLTDDSLYNLFIQQLQVVDETLVEKDFSALRCGDTISYESVLTTENGHCVPVHVYAREVKIEGVSHLQWILHDITERKNLETLQNDLISMIYHDLRSPLANVVSSLDVLETLLPLENDPALKSLLNIAVRSTERIQRLTNSLLDMRKIEAGQPVGHRQHVAVDTLIREAFETVETTAETKHQKIRVEIPTSLPNVLVDQDMIRRVLINLLENAIKYTAQESEISLGVKENNGGLQVWVQDTGQGIPPSDQERIFDKFSRLNSKEGPRGFGLGLAYCKLAVEAHGGQIWVESKPGEGACFNFTLPKANAVPPFSSTTD